MLDRQGAGITYPRPGRSVGWLIVLFVSALLVSGCGRKDPQDGFWGFAWGTPMDSVLSDSADIAHRLSGPNFALVREPGRLIFSDVQYGLGYTQIELDFLEESGLWHGHVRVPVGSHAEADSILNVWHDRYGRETSERRIDGAEGYSTYWRTGAWLDRHFFATTLAPHRAPAEVEAVDLLVGGCIECPLYALRLRPDGSAILHSTRDYDPEGGYAGSFDTAGLAELSADLIAPDFLALASLYSPQTGGGLPTHGVRMHLPDRQMLYQSADSCGPPVLEEVLRQLNRIAHTARWTTRLVDWDTVHPRVQKAVDLDSLEVLAGSASKSQ